MQIDWETIPLRTKRAFNIARKRAPTEHENVRVRIRTGDGVEGWGEAPATPFYGETSATVAAILPRLTAALRRSVEDDFELERAERALDAAVGRNPAAKAAVSAALHDLAGKRLGLPVWRWWGLATETAPLSSFTIGLDTVEVVRKKAREAAKFPVLKIKLGSDDDEAILGAVRDEAPDALLRVDANTGWTARQAIRALPMLEEYGVELLEQPVRAEDVDGLRAVRAASRIPVIADESCERATDVARLAGAVDGVNIKLAKCGSLREALRMVHTARAHNMQVMLGCMVESTLGIAAALQLAPLVDYVDLDGAALLASDPFTGPGLESDGSLRFNREPGLGVTLAGG
ncbi:dipeptide epimerase [soil metagenome]